MLDVQNKKCMCGKAQPNFGSPGDIAATCCIKCATEGMINITQRTCECGKHQPIYGEVGSQATCCTACKREGMVDLNHKKCLCGKARPTYGASSDMIAVSCAACRSDDMIDVLHPVCRAEFCANRARTEYFDGHCFRCFVYLFPDHRCSRSFKVKEQHLVDSVGELIVRKDLHFTVVYDRAIAGGCSKRRPDCFIDCLTHCLLIECDEFQHRDYDEICENKRTMQLFTDVANRPLVIVRLNPDGYVKKDGAKVPSCFSRHQRLDVPLVKKKEWAVRTSVLEEHVMHHLHNVPEKEVTVVRLFYDGYN